MGGSSGGGGGTPTSSTTNTSNLPEYARPYFERLMGRAEAESNQPYTTYPNQRIAGFTGDTNQAFDITRNVANQGTPGVNAGMGMTQQAGDIGFKAQEAFGQKQADQYMSPYMNNVIELQKNAALRDYNEGRPSRDTQAINQGAFGGYRDSIQQGVAQRGLANRMNEIEGSGRQQAYTNAQQQYNADRGASLAGGNLGLQAGAQMGALNAQQQGLRLAQAQALNAQGTAQQNLQQRELDTGYQDFINQRDYLRNNISYLSNILRGVPVTPNTVQTQYSNPNPLSQYAGLGIAGLGLARSA
jgi:hypothetical protein